MRDTCGSGGDGEAAGNGQGAGEEMNELAAVVDARLQDVEEEVAAMRHGVEGSNQGIRNVEEKLEALEANIGAKLARLERLLLRSLGEDGEDGAAEPSGGLL